MGMTFKRNILILTLFICLLFIFCSITAYSSLIKWDLGYEYTNAMQPEGPSPWITITINDELIQDSIVLEITSHLIGSEFINSIFFNVDLSPSYLCYEFDSSTAPSPLIMYEPDSYHAAGDGWFDFKLDFTLNPQNRFTNDKTLLLCIVNPYITAESFDELSVNSPNPLFCSAHIGGIGENADDSGWVTNTPTPEPSSLIFLLIGLPLAFIKRK